MAAIEILRERVNALMRQRGWTSNRPLIEASGGKLTNGTLGRIRGASENCQLSQVDALAEVFGVQAWELLKADGELHVAPAKSLSLGAAVSRIAKALSGVPESRRRTISTLAASQLAEPTGAEELAALDALAPNAQIGMPVIGEAEAEELQALREWHNAIMAMMDLEAPRERETIARFLLKVESARLEQDAARARGSASEVGRTANAPTKAR